MTTVTELTLKELLETYEFICGCSDEQYKRTPLLVHWKDLGDCAELSRHCDLYLKMENMQVTGACSVLITHVHSVYQHSSFFVSVFLYTCCVGFLNFFVIYIIYAHVKCKCSLILCSVCNSLLKLLLLNFK